MLISIFVMASLVISFVCGGLAGYFLNPWVQIAVIVIFFCGLWYASCDKSPDSGLYPLLLFILAAAGLMVGNLIYYIQHTSFVINSSGFGNWFVR